MPFRLDNRHQLGQQGEIIALQYLSQQGLHLLEKNYRARKFEIDLIMYDQSCCFVFVEVKTRAKMDLNAAVSDIDNKKLQHLQSASEIYFREKKIPPRCLSRFDIVCCGSQNSAIVVLDWIRNISL